jgi:large subunit ribosomal protein L4
MAKAICYEKDGTEAGNVDLPASLFESVVNEDVVHQAVVAYQANQRQGSASTRERSDVRGGGRKPYRQKGTGRARAGTIRSPIFRGGGVVFGPHPRDYRQKMTKKMRRLALKSSLTVRASDGSIVVIKSLDFAEPKTRELAAILKNMNAHESKTLLVTDGEHENTVKSARNLRSVRVKLARNVSTYDVVWADKIVVTTDAVKKMEEVFAS